MIEEIVIDHLLKKLKVKAYMETPERDAPGEYVLIEKTGSSNENLITTSTFAIKSISTSMLGAAKLNEAVKEAMSTLIENNAVSRCKLDSDYNFSDPDATKYRYQAVYDITHY